MFHKVNISAFIANHSQEFRATFAITVPINIIFSLTATISNSIVIIAMAKNVSLKSPCNALLFCLALSDLGVGLISQPLYIFWKIDWLLNPSTSNYELFAMCYKITSSYFAGVSFLTMAGVSLERYLCLHFHLRYDTLATVRRVLTASLFPWMFVGVLTVLDLLFGYVYLYASVIIMPLCFLQSLACYLKLFFVLRRHQNQISIQFKAADGHVKATTNTNALQSLARFRSSVKNMFLLFFFLILCNLPFCLLQACGRNIITVPFSIARNFAITLVHINSSINPLMYCYRIPTVRNAVKDLLHINRNLDD